MKLLAAMLLAGTLYDQSVSKLLQERFRDPDVSYLALDARSGDTIASRWDELETPRSVGSLMKPLLAAKYQGEYPVLQCDPKRCWRSHGRVGIVEALAQSCNSYFLQLASRFRASGLSPEALIGLGDEYKVAPLWVARAYCKIDRESILRGMRASAQHGTGRAIAMDALVKTGTAPCTHEHHAPGDGYAMALYPANAPRYALMVELHGAPGAKAAEVAGKMLLVIAEGR
jgi:cell division protein FtsI/penicillin-binding protein 2